MKMEARYYPAGFEDERRGNKQRDAGHTALEAGKDQTGNSPLGPLEGLVISVR